MKKPVLVLIVSIMILPTITNAGDDDDFATIILQNALYEQGVESFDKGKYDKAIDEFNTLLEVSPNNVSALYYRGLAYFKKGNYDKTLEDFNAVLKIKPDDINALLNRGLVYGIKGNHDRSIEDFEAVLRIDPNNQETKKYLAIAREKRGSKTSQPSANNNQQQQMANQGVSTIKDPRDNKTYRVVKIGNQVWMAENLNYNASGSKCYDNNSANCDKYGRLYNWNTARIACPNGWHLPSNGEWQILVNLAGGDNSAGKKLKATSGWKNNGNGTDALGFSALPGGNGYSVGSFLYVGSLGYWWSASEYSSYNAYYRYMGYDSERVSYGGYEKDILFSVRCLQDSP